MTREAVLQFILMALFSNKPDDGPMRVPARRLGDQPPDIAMYRQGTLNVSPCTLEVFFPPFLSL